MNLVLAVETFDVINDILNDITGYGRERKVNFTINLFQILEDELVFKVTYNDTGKVVFDGTIKQENFIEAIKNEDEKEKQKEKEHHAE